MKNLDAIVARRSQIHVEKDIAVALIESYPHIMNAMHLQTENFDGDDSPEPYKYEPIKRMTNKERFKNRDYDGYTKQEIKDEQQEEKYLDYYFEFPVRYKDKLDLIERELGAMDNKTLKKFVNDNESKRKLLDKKYPNAADFLNGMYFFNNV